MTEEPTSVEPPEMHAPHKAHTGQRWVDMLLALTAVLVSAISLYVAIDNGRSMERLVAANSWPNLQFDQSVTTGTGSGDAKLTLEVTNNGVGPARLQTLEIWGDGAAMSDANGLGRWIKQLGSGAPLAVRFEGSTVTGNVIGVGESSLIIGMTVADGATWTNPLVLAVGKVDSRLCYCSVFEDCYLSDTRVARGRPKPVKACPVPAMPYDDDLTKITIKTPPITSPPQQSSKS